MDCVTTFEQKSMAITTTNNNKKTVEVTSGFFKTVWFLNKGVNVVGYYGVKRTFLKIFKKSLTFY